VICWRWARSNTHRTGCNDLAEPRPGANTLQRPLRSRFRARLSRGLGQIKRRRDYAMQAAVITRRDDLSRHQLVPELGEAMLWHTNACHRFSAIGCGQQLTIEFRETGEPDGVVVLLGLGGWFRTNIAVIARHMHAPDGHVRMVSRVGGVETQNSSSSRGANHRAQAVQWKP
jgi:hypothetical protein